MHYVRADDIPSPQLLCLEHGGRQYRFNLLHATLGERRVGGAVRHPHSHPYYHIVLYTSGNNSFLLEGGETPLRAGTLVLCPPSLPHDFGPAAPGTTLYHELTFELFGESGPLEAPLHDLLSRYAGAALAPLPVVSLLPPRLFAEVRDLMQGVVHAACSPLPTALFDAHRALLDLLALLAQQLGQLPLRDRDRIAEARRQIARRFADPLRIERLASELDLAPTYLSRAFRQRYGVSPLQYRQELRTVAARRLLQLGSLSCKEIAARLGFADVQTFTKAFTRRYGTPPARMRAAGQAT